MYRTCTAEIYDYELIIVQENTLLLEPPYYKCMWRIKLMFPLYNI